MRFKDFPMSLCFLPTSHTQKACIKSRAVQAKGGGMYGGPRNMYQVYKFPPWYCCKHMKCLSFYSLSRSGWVFLKDMSHGECCWRHDFWASRFQNYLWEDTPDPNSNLRLRRSFSSPTELKIRCAVPDHSWWGKRRLFRLRLILTLQFQFQPPCLSNLS